MIAGRGSSGWSRRFTESGHLALDAVVAFVDDELPSGPAQRAAAHVERCLTCAGEVAAQRQARRRVRGADCPAVPSALLSALRSIPEATPLPGPPAGLSVAPDGSLVIPVDGREVAAPAPGRRGRRRFGLPVAVGSGVVVGAAALVALTGPAVVAGGAGAGLPAGAAVRPTGTNPADLTAGTIDVASIRPTVGPALRGPGAP